LEDLVLIGEIKAVDSDGFLSVFSYSDFPDRFQNLKSVFIEIYGVVRPFFVEDSAINGNKIFLKFRNFNSSDEASFLIGKKFFILPAELVKLKEDEFYVHDLIGSVVIRNDIKVGVIEDLIETPANDVLVIISDDGEELLIPVVKIFVDSFDQENKTLYLKPGEESIYDDED